MKQLIFCTILLLLSCPVIFGQETANNCPEITVIGPMGVTQPGDTMTFTAEVKNFSGTSEIKYEWNLSAGTIEKGQWTSSIVVRTTEAMANSDVTATVKIGGIPNGCTDSAAGKGEITPKAMCECSADEFGSLSKNEVRARINNYYIRLNNDVNLKGLIHVEVNTKASRRSKMLYLNNLSDAITSRKQDPKRVTFVVSEVNDKFGTRTTLWLLQLGVDFPVGDENSIIIKGEDFKQKIKDLFKPNK